MFPFQLNHIGKHFQNSPVVLKGSEYAALGVGVF